MCALPPSLSLSLSLPPSSHSLEINILKEPTQDEVEFLSVNVLRVPDVLNLKIHHLIIRFLCRYVADWRYWTTLLLV